jgi:hypothetical protein
LIAIDNLSAGCLCHSLFPREVLNGMQRPWMQLDPDKGSSRQGCRDLFQELVEICVELFNAVFVKV